MNTREVNRRLLGDPLCTGHKEHDDLVGLVSELANNVVRLEGQVERQEKQIARLELRIENLRLVDDLQQ